MSNFLPMTFYLDILLIEILSKKYSLVKNGSCESFRSYDVFKIEKIAFNAVFGPFHAKFALKMTKKI